MWLWMTRRGRKGGCSGPGNNRGNSIRRSAVLSGVYDCYGIAWDAMQCEAKQRVEVAAKG